MAVNEGLVVTFRGDTAPMTKSLADLQAQLKRFQTTLQTATDPSAIARLNRAIDATGDRIKAVQNFKGFNNLTKGSNTATRALIDLNRVAQDAPYGLMGIANNIEPLVLSFRELKKESGSGAAALKALGSSMLGPTGVLFAFSVASSLLIKYGDQLFNTKTLAEKNAEAIKKQRQALQDYIEGLKDVAKARLLGAQNAQEELVKLQAIYTATQNTNLSYAERKKAVDALQDQYPKYFANMKDEAILAGRGKEAYDKLSAAIVASARARAGQDTLVDIQKDLLNIATQRTEEEAKLQAQQAASAKTVNDTYKNIVKSRGAEGATIRGTKEIRDSEKEIEKTKSNINKLNKQENALLQRQSLLVKSIQAGVEADGVDTILGDVKSKIDKVNGEKAQVNFFDKYFDFDYNSSNLKAKQQDELLKAARDFQKEFGNIFKGLDFYKGTEASSLNAARAWWANFNKGIVEFKHDAFTNIDLKVDIPVLLDTQKVGVEEYLDTIKGQFEKGAKSIQLPDFSITKHDQDRQALLDHYTKLFNWVGKELPKTVQLDNGLFKDLDAITNLDQLKEGLSNTLSEAQRQLQTVADLVDRTLAPAFNNLFNAITSGEDPLKAFFSSIGQSVQQLISQLIAAAVQAAILSLLTGGASGGGMSFLGAFKKITGMASGGIIPSGFEGDKFPAMLNSGEAVIPLDKIHKYIGGGFGNGNITITGRLRGNDLELQRARTGRSQRRTG